MVKFEFSVKTRDGLQVNRIVIMGSDQCDAERKLRQMYRHCEVLQCGIRERNTLRCESLASAFMLRVAKAN